MSNGRKVVADAIHIGDWWIKGNKNKRAKGILHLPAEGEFKLEVHGDLGRWAAVRALFSDQPAAAKILLYLITRIQILLSASADIFAPSRRRSFWKTRTSLISPNKCSQTRRGFYASRRMVRRTDYIWRGTFKRRI